MDKKDFKGYIYMGATAVAVIVICILVWYCVQHGAAVGGKVREILKILAPVIYGAVLAYLIAPVYNRVVHVVQTGLGSAWKDEKRVTSVAKLTGTVISLVFIFVIIAGMLQLLIPQLVESILGIRDSFPIYLQNLYTWIQKILADNPEIESYVLANLQDTVAMLESWLERSFVNIDLARLTEILTGVSSSVMGVVDFIMNWFIGLIVMVYLLNIKDVLTAQGKKIIYGSMKLPLANAVIEELRFVHQMFGGFIIGKLVDSLIIGIICFVGVSLMKMPYAMLISVIVGVTNIIPFFGPFIGAIPTGFLLLLVSPVKCAYFLLWILLLQQFDGNILGPKILGNSTGLSSFWVLFSILVFGGLFGFVGMIIAVPTFAVFYDLLARAVHHSLRGRKLPTATADYMELDHIDEKNGNLVK